MPDTIKPDVTVQAPARQCFCGKGGFGAPCPECFDALAKVAAARWRGMSQNHRFGADSGALRRQDAEEF